MIEKLYKYYSIEDDNKKRIVNRLNGELYFASPLQFNDPYDCQLPEIINNTSSRPQGEIMKILSECGFDESTYRRLMEEDAETIKNVYIAQADNLGILCLTSNYTNMLMWSHYAGHNGICLEYDAEKLINALYDRILYYIRQSGKHCPTYNPYKRIFCKSVIYECCLPVTSKLFFDHSSDCIPKYWYKLNDWEYENEFRIGVSLGSRMAVTINDIVTHVYLGCNASERQVNDIMQILKLNDFDIPISIMIKGRYGLESQTI